MRDTGIERGAGIDGLAGMASPLYAVLARHGGTTSSAGPAAGMLRLAVRRFSAAVRAEVASACGRELSARSPDPAVAAAALDGVASVARSYAAGAGGPAGRVSVVQGAEASRAGERVRGLLAGAVLGAERAAADLRARLAPLAKFVDGAHVVAVGPSAGSLYPKLARAVVLASLAGVATMTLSDGAHARPTAVEIQAQQAQVSFDDLFKKSFGGAISATTVPGAAKPSGAAAPQAPRPAAVPAPSAHPVAAPPAMAQAPGFEGPSQVFRTMARQFLKVHGGNGDNAGRVLDKLLLDARECTDRFGADMRCKVYRDDVGIDLARGRFEIRNPDGTGALLVSEERGRDMQMLDPTGFSSVLQGADHYVATPSDRSVRKVTASGRPYYEPSKAFLKMAQALVEIKVGDDHEAYDQLDEAVALARICIDDPSRAGRCDVTVHGVSIDMEKGEFAAYGSWAPGQDPVLLVKETAQRGFQVVNPTGLAKVMVSVMAMRDPAQPTGRRVADDSSPGLGARMR